MRIKRSSLFKLAAGFTVLAFLFGVTAAGAADRAERGVKAPQQTQNQSHFQSLGTGKYKGLPSFLKLLAQSNCTSSCCWASANCDGANTVCSETRCDAWCADGSHSAYICPVRQAVAQQLDQ